MTDTSDLSNDGLSDSWENTNGFNPRVADRVRLSAPTSVTNGGFTLTLSEVFGRDVVVQVSSDLVNWVVLTNFTGLDGPIEFVDPTTPRPSERFYRAVIGRPFVFGQPMTLTSAGFTLSIENFTGLGFALQAATNFVDWLTLTNFNAGQTRIQYLDPETAQKSARFYRAMLQ